MSAYKTIKEYNKLYYLDKSTGLMRETKIFTDSKGFCLEKVVRDSVKNNIKIVARSGATVSWDNQTQELLRTVKKAYKPVILIWLGTCEVTFKEGKYIRVRNFPYQNVEYTLTEYRELRHKIIHVNRQSKIVFIECPYYSMTKPNRNFASQRKTVKNNHSKAQVTYKGNKTGTDKNNNNKAQVA
jgi:hypothetical protein